jgi:HK97 family phage prohead protease
MSLRTETRAFGLTEVKLAGGDTGTFEGYGAVFGNVDSYGDVIAKGAFAGSLREWEKRGKFPPMLLQHGGGMFGGGASDQLPVGKWEHMEERSKGLWVKGKLFAMTTERGQYIHEGLTEACSTACPSAFARARRPRAPSPASPRAP